MKKFWLFSVLVLSVLAHFVGAQETCVEATTIREAYYSAWLGQEMVYTIVTPPCFDVTKTYPTVYLMHGSNDDDGHWLRLGLVDELTTGIREGSLAEMIVVLPFGNNIANRNLFDTMSWNNIFLTELMPYVQAKYPAISTNPAQAAIGGISRGGFWAYQIGLRHPELFGSIGGHSAFFDLYHAEAVDNPLDLVLSQPDVPSQRLWLDRGMDDYAAPGLDIMNERMADRGLTHSYTIYPQGQHNNDYWGSHVRDYLNFYGQGFMSATEQIATPAPVTGFATNTPLAVEPSATPQAQSESSTATTYNLFLPVVAFPSIRTSLSDADLQAIVNGQAPVPLVMDIETQAALFQNGVIFENAQIVNVGEVDKVLWDNYDAVALMPIQDLTLRVRPLWWDDQPIFAQISEYPLAFAASNGNFDPTKFGRVTASGVTALTRQTTDALNNTTIQDAASGIKWYVDQSDIFHTSNEVSISDPCPNVGSPDRLGVFCSKAEHFEVLTAVGVDLVELTGNHNTDYGFALYDQTLTWYQERNMAIVGGGLDILAAQAPFTHEINGTTIGWIACNDAGPYYALVTDKSYGIDHGGAAPCDREWLRDVLPVLDKQVDVLIVTVQQLEVEDYIPPTNQRNFFQLLVDLGADFVGGTAAHKPQIFQYYGDRLIHHGFGNLFFDQPFWGNSRFFMDTLLLYDGKLMSIELFPGIIDNQYRPRLMNTEERENWMYFMLRQKSGF